jgi:hypothetical protein
LSIVVVDPPAGVGPAIRSVMPAAQRIAVMKQDSVQIVFNFTGLQCLDGIYGVNR